ncbi:hypothetical protein [Thiocapsa imhoffii]|uniref:hypothetical protein n=1 Tax=Thiocapsa imhoffii TaxID=382777 RepID=UPI001903A09B|nr:hypothetical protein [Thiocapsa imhoffii]
MTVRGKIIDGVRYDRDGDNWSLGVRDPLIDRSELFTAWNQRIDNTDHHNLNSFTPK